MEEGHEVVLRGALTEPRRHSAEGNIAGKRSDHDIGSSWTNSTRAGRVVRVEPHLRDAIVGIFGVGRGPSLPK